MFGRGFCNHEQFLSLRAAAQDHTLVAATIAYYTGMRKGEILSPEWDKHVDMSVHSTGEKTN